jgi:catechol 2,3-dioxygenase-like lactoylglutathione lyase family enzyme
MIRTRGLSHIELRVGDVDDVERTVRFYGDVFGFEVVARSADRALLQVPGGLGSLAVELADGAGAGDDGDHLPAGVVHFGFVLSDPRELDAAVHLAVAHGGTLVARTDHALGGTTVTLADPAGHRITL